MMRIFEKNFTVCGERRSLPFPGNQLDSMRVVIQRVKEASVTINEVQTAHIEKGLLVLAGFESTDTEEDLSWTAHKIVNMRIFSDPEGKMNLSLGDVDGSILLVSQFTLHAQTQRGNRPSFIRAARPECSIPLYESFIQHLSVLCQHPVQTGIFGTDMQVALLNDGPVTITMDSKVRE